MAFREACLANLGFLLDLGGDEQQEGHNLMFRDHSDVQATNKESGSHTAAKI